MSLNKKEKSHYIEGELFYARFVEKDLVVSQHEILEYLSNNKYKVKFGKTAIILKEGKVGSDKKMALVKLMANMALEESQLNLKISKLKIKMDTVRKEINGE